MEDIYNYYGDDMHMTLDEFKGEVTRWRHRWPITEDDPPQTLVETLDFADPELYPGIYVAVKTLLTYPVSTCVAERSFSSMKRQEEAQDATSKHHVGRQVVLVVRVAHP